MRIVEARFLRGPNVHHMRPCFVALVDLEDCVDGVVTGLVVDHGGTVHACHSRHPLLLPLLPQGTVPGLGDRAAWAKLLLDLVSTVQALADGSNRSASSARFSETVTALAAVPQHFRLVCDYQHEAVAEEALRTAVDIVSALVRQQPLDIDARLAKVRGLDFARVESLLTTIPARRDQGDGHWPNPVIAVTGTNGKTTTAQLIAHVLRFNKVPTGLATTQGIYIDGECVQVGDCSGYWSARRVLTDPLVQAAVLETARGGILKRGLGFQHCDVGVVLNVSSDHLGLDGVETLQDLARVKGLVVRCAQKAAVLNADDPLCVSMRETLAPGCVPVFFTLDPLNSVFLDHLLAGGAGACLDANGWLVWCCNGERTPVVKAAQLPFTWQGYARYNTANALAALAALCCLGYETEDIERAMAVFVSDAKTNPLRGNQFEVDGVKLIVDYAHNAVACRAVCELARAMAKGAARVVGVVTSPGDRRAQDLFDTGEVCGRGFDELVVYEQDPRGRRAGALTEQLLKGARSAAPDKPQHSEPDIRRALFLGLALARPGDVLVFTCAGNFDDLVAGIRLKSPAAADKIALELSH